MMKLILILTSAILLSACQKLPAPVCTGTAIVGGQETSVNIYGIRKVVNQTEYKAGPPFNWQWVNKSAFTHTTCDK
nr:cor protein [Pantoea sp. BAV 3049]